MTERLTAADSWFLYLETPAMHLHVAGLLILDPSTAPDGVDPEVLREHLAARIHLLAMFRRRLVFVPFGLDHPVWIDDPDFDLDRHLHVRSVTGDDELRELLGEICSEPLDREAPLWEMHFIEGLHGGRIALLIKIHHALIDGVSGMAFLEDLLDLSPEVVPPEPPQEPWQPEPLPGAVESLWDAVADRLSTPGRPLAPLCARPAPPSTSCRPQREPGAPDTPWRDPSTHRAPDSTPRSPPAEASPSAPSGWRRSRQPSGPSGPRSTTSCWPHAPEDCEVS